MADKARVDLSGIALSGLERAQEAFETSARDVSRAALPSETPEGAPVDTVDLSAAIIEMLQARNDFKVNIQVAKTADEMERAALDIFA